MLDRVTNQVHKIASTFVTFCLFHLTMRTRTNNAIPNSYAKAHRKSGEPIDLALRPPLSDDKFAGDETG